MWMEEDVSSVEVFVNLCVVRKEIPKHFEF